MDWFWSKSKKKDKDNQNQTIVVASAGDLPTASCNNGKPIYLESRFIEDQLIYGDLSDIITIPQFMDRQEWLATHAIAFFNNLLEICGSISEFCTSNSCPTMAVPNNMIYQWLDKKTNKSKYSAPQYIDQAMAYIQTTITDETIFPCKQDQHFPGDVNTVLKKIYRFLIHVIAHIYHVHFGHLVSLRLVKHLNCLFKHLYAFVKRYNLCDPKEIPQSLVDLANALSASSGNNLVTSSSSDKSYSSAADVSSDKKDASGGDSRTDTAESNNPTAQLDSDSDLPLTFKTEVAATTELHVRSKPDGRIKIVPKPLGRKHIAANEFVNRRLSSDTSTEIMLAAC